MSVIEIATLDLDIPSKLLELISMAAFVYFSIANIIIYEGQCLFWKIITH